MPPMKKTSAPKKVVAKVKKVSKPKEVVKAPSVKEPSVKDPSVKEPIAPTETPIVATVDTVSSYSEEFSHLLTNLKSLQNTLKELTIYTTKLEKRVAKDQKAVQKRVNGKRRNKSGNSSPSGFSKPGKVSDELRSFLGLKADELVARTEVTKRINAYCKEKGLQDQKDKRILKADKTLQKLLRLKPSDELTFFNLQKYMKVHFPNKEGVYPSA